MSDELVIRPLEWHWQDWLDRFRKMEADRKALTKANADDFNTLFRLVSDWKKEALTHFSSLTTNQKEDVVSLLMVEAEMLIESADPPQGYQPNDSDRFEFRTRYYEALPLLALAEDLSFPKAAAARSYFNDVESFATKREWLP